MISDSLSLELTQSSDEELHRKTLRVAKDEQEMTIRLLYHLCEIERRKLYAAKGYGSLWSYVQEALHYSETQTAERISAMKLMFRDPSAKVAVESGAITLTQAAMTERFLRAEEKENRAPVPVPKVRSLIEEVKGLSKRDTEKVLLSFRPQEKSKERVRQIDSCLNEIRFSISVDVRKEMERYWELKGYCSMSELFSACLNFYLDQKDPKRKKIMAKPRALPAKLKTQSRYVSQSVRQAVQKRSEGQCEYVDKATHRRCESRYLLQYDHIQPYAWGGTSDHKNIRHLCAMHNGFLAERMFARELPASYLAGQTRHETITVFSPIGN